MTSAPVRKVGVCCCALSAAPTARNPTAICHTRIAIGYRGLESTGTAGRPSQPPEKQDDDDGRDERRPPHVDAHRREAARAALDEGHDGGGPREGADQIERAEL